jgi:hypothetical protein
MMKAGTSVLEINFPVFPSTRGMLLLCLGASSDELVADVHWRREMSNCRGEGANKGRPALFREQGSAIILEPNADDERHRFWSNIPWI